MVSDGGALDRWQDEHVTPRQLLLLAALCCARPSHAGEEALVDVGALVPDAVLDIRYATPNNFTHQVIYPEARCRLRRSTAERLARVAAALRRQRLRLRVFDCDRPLAVQRRFWALVPDERYVANPDKGSRHNRGAAIDLTLADARGQALPMPSEYDDFSERAHRDYEGASKEALANRRQLETAMRKQGFIPMPTEWWHFDDPEWQRHALH
jgi:zinc D-Ala-D-Ala dipeptidase